LAAASRKPVLGTVVRRRGGGDAVERWRPYRGSDGGGGAHPVVGSTTFDRIRVSL